MALHPASSAARPNTAPNLRSFTLVIKLIPERIIPAYLAARSSTARFIVTQLLQQIALAASKLRIR
jgi:hypothetical protein